MGSEHGFYRLYLGDKFVAAMSSSVAPVISGTIFPFGADDEAYAGFVPTLDSGGSGAGPVTWSLASGSLPGGLSLNTSTGAVTGTPTTPGTYAFGIKAANSSGDSNVISVTGFEVIPANLWTQGKNLSHGDWSKERSTISESAADPVGGTGAETLLEATDDNTHNTNQTLAKTATEIEYRSIAIVAPQNRDWVTLEALDTGFAGGVGIYFDITNGVVGSNNYTYGGFSGVSSAITALGGGYYKIEMTYTTNDATSLRLYTGPATADGTNSYAGDTAKGTRYFGVYTYAT